MITFLVGPRHAHHLDAYLASWGRHRRDRIRVVEYYDLAAGRSLHAGTVVFCESASGLERDFAIETWKRLVDDSRFRLLNDPSKTLGRLALIAELAARGLSEFAAYRASSLDVSRIRFPVFVRCVDEPFSSSTRLVEDPPALEDAIRRFETRASRDRLVVTEYCDARGSDEVFRKYSVFRVGERFLAHHLVFSHRWNLKRYDLLEPSMLMEERRFLDSNPHDEWLRTVFDIANIEFGRIDYGVSKERPQAWEINTDPMIMLPPTSYPRRVLDSRREFIRRLEMAFDAIELPDRGVEIRLEYDRDLRESMAKAALARRAEVAARGRSRRGWRGLVGRVRASLRARLRPPR